MCVKIVSMEFTCVLVAFLCAVGITRLSADKDCFFTMGAHPHQDKVPMDIPCQSQVEKIQDFYKLYTPV